VITSAYGLPCKAVVHTVGPRFNKSNPEESKQLLIKAITGILELMETYGIKSLACPGISSGIFGYPKPDCA